MLSTIKSRVSKAGLPPGTLVYTGRYKLATSRLSMTVYDANNCEYIADAKLEQCLIQPTAGKMIWINIVGLQNINLIDKICANFNIHPLVVEDILNTKQRLKIEEYDNYFFIALKKLSWHAKKEEFETEQISFVFGEGFLISFQERENSVFDSIQDRLHRGKARLREHGSDYLAYSLLDAVVDEYFVILEMLDEQIEKIEELIVAYPTSKNAHALYHLKRQMFLFKKVVWPLREVINNLLRSEGKLITPFVMPYLRDIYDHAMQVVDTVETLRDMLGNMLDAYLSSLTNRMNEIMKVLTIIATIFIPLTFITGLYGMNFEYMPEIHWRWGYPTTVAIMIVIVLGMLFYFRRKKWL